MIRSKTDVAVLVIGIGYCLAVLIAVLMSGCQVYEEPSQCGRAHPGGGVTVRYAELADDGGFE